MFGRKDPPRYAIRFPLFVAAVVLVAGCSGPGQGPQDAAASSSAPVGDASHVGAPTPQAGDAEAPAEWESMPLDWPGRTGVGLCAPTGPGSCMGGSFAADEFSMLEVAGANSWRIRANVTWETLAPTTEELRVTITPYRSCGEACVESVGSGYLVEGASPLRIDAALETPLDADGLWLSVLQPPTPTPAGLLAVFTPQEFLMEGTAMHRPASEEAPSDSPR